MLHNISNSIEELTPYAVTNMDSTFTVVSPRLTKPIRKSSIAGRTFCDKFSRAAIYHFEEQIPLICLKDSL